MKRYTVIFSTERYACIGIICEFSPKPSIGSPWNKLMFKGWYGATLKEAYKRYLKNKEGTWREQDPVNGCSGWSRPQNSTTDMYYEITEKELLALIKIEELTLEL